MGRDARVLGHSGERRPRGHVYEMGQSAIERHSAGPLWTTPRRIGGARSAAWHEDHGTSAARSYCLVAINMEIRSATTSDNDHQHNANPEPDNCHQNLAQLMHSDQKPLTEGSPTPALALTNGELPSHTQERVRGSVLCLDEAHVRITGGHQIDL